MDAIKQVQVKNVNGTFEQVVPLGTESIYVTRINGETAEQAFQDIETDISIINGDASVMYSTDWKIDRDINELETKIDSNNLDNKYNTFALVEEEFDKLNGGIEIPGSIDNKINETIINGEIDYIDLKSVGDEFRFLKGEEEGSIKNLISTAKSEILGGADDDYDTLKEIQTLFEKIRTDEEEGFDTLGEIAVGIKTNADNIAKANTDIQETNKSINTKISTVEENLEKTKSQLQKEDESIREKVEELQGTISPGETLEYGNIASINNILTSLTGEQSNPLVASIDERINEGIDVAISEVVGEAKEELNTLEKLGNSLTDLKTKVDNENNLVTYSIDLVLAEGIRCNLARYGYLISVNISAYGVGFETGIELLKTLQINLFDYFKDIEDYFRNNPGMITPIIKKLIPLNNTDVCVMNADNGQIYFSGFQIANNSQQLFYGISEIYTIQPVDEIKA